MNRLFLAALAFLFCCVLPAALNAQTGKSKKTCQLPIIDLDACEIPEKGLTVVFKRTLTPIKDKEYTNAIMVEYGFYYVKNGIERPMRFAKGKTLITTHQYDELPEARLRILFDKEQIKTEANNIKFTDNLISGEPGYQLSVKNLLRKVLGNTKLAQSENKVYVMVYPNRTGEKDPLEISVGLVPAQITDDTCYEVLFDPGKRVSVSNLFVYIDIDGCTDTDVLLSAIKDSLDAVRKSGGSYYIYLSNPSSEAYWVRSSDTETDERYLDIFNEIRRIEPGRAKIEKDIEVLRDELTRTVKTAKSKGLKPEELQFFFILPTGIAGTTHKKMWEDEIHGNNAERIKGIAKSEDFKMKPVFYTCAFEAL